MMASRLQRVASVSAIRSATTLYRMDSVSARMFVKSPDAQQHSKLSASGCCIQGGR